MTGPRDDIEQEGLTTLNSRRLRGIAALAFALASVPLAVPGVLAAEGLTLTTPYPGLTVSPGTSVSFDLSVATTSPARVNLALSGVPSSWTAQLHGGGFVVSAVQTDGDKPTDVRLDVDVPDDASGTTTITVTATSTGSTATLPLLIKVEANAGGEVKVTPDYTQLRGSADQSFTFNLNVSNKTAEDLTFTATGEGPTGWTVDVTLTGQAQAVSGTVKAGGASNIAVKVTPADNADAGTYKNTVVATVGSQQFPIDLSVEVTGSYSMQLSTPTQVLSANGPAGSVTEQTFSVTNTGTAPITNVVLSGSLPQNWKVEFDPAKTDSIAAGQSVTVTARITPSSDAIAGDYSLTFTGRADETNDQAEIRFTVEASIVGALIGVALIIAFIGGLLWVFRRYGRR
jgi:uncharacterized repeat protein (TIGR01451 family)